MMNLKICLNDSKESCYPLTEIIRVQKTSESLNISIFNARMNNAFAVVRQPYSPGVVV